MARYLVLLMCWHPALSTSAASRALLPSPRLQKELREWLGEGVYNRLAGAVDHDDHLMGYAVSCEGSHEIDESILRRHKAGGACADFPASLATHVWRYDQQNVAACLTLEANSTCQLRCRHLPGLLTEISCSSSGILSGSPPLGECRHKPDTEIVQTSAGAIRGLVRPIPMLWASGHHSIERVRTFWDVPYAEPPGRFRAPQRKARWAGVRESADYYESSPPLCSNLPPLGRGGNVTEDCLRLHMYTSTTASAQSLQPVIVYFFGAGFVGSDYFLNGWYDAARFALRNSAIFVGVSFRVGFLGHWAHPGLAAEAEDGGFGNYGALDQRAALQWVQTNIAHFGGDPTRVTIAGHSSGAFAVQFHFLSPASRGLFSSAILEGTALDSGWYFAERGEAIAFYAGVAERLGCKGGLGSARQLGCLRACRCPPSGTLTSSRSTRS